MLSSILHIQTFSYFWAFIKMLFKVVNKIFWSLLLMPECWLLSAISTICFPTAIICSASAWDSALRSAGGSWSLLITSLLTRFFILLLVAAPKAAGGTPLPPFSTDHGALPAGQAGYATSEMVVLISSVRGRLFSLLLLAKRNSSFYRKTKWR